MNELEKAIEKRNKFLQENPNMQEFQNEIDKIMDKTPAYMRKEVIITLMMSKIQELREQLKLLSTYENG